MSNTILKILNSHKIHMNKSDIFVQITWLHEQLSPILIVQISMFQNSTISVTIIKYSKKNNEFHINTKTSHTN